MSATALLAMTDGTAAMPVIKSCRRFIGRFLKLDMMADTLGRQVCLYCICVEDFKYELVFSFNYEERTLFRDLATQLWIERE
jgi:hypothetical protein